MALTLATTTTEATTLEDYVDYVNSHVNLNDLDSIASSADELRKLSNNRHFITEKINCELANWKNFQTGNSYTSQTIINPHHLRWRNSMSRNAIAVSMVYLTLLACSSVPAGPLGVCDLRAALLDRQDGSRALLDPGSRAEDSPASRVDGRTVPAVSRPGRG